jgi:excisionase family DNA binding protein
MIELLTAKDIAEALKVKTSTVYAWAERGDIPHFKLNGTLRFSGDEVTRWVQGNHKEPEAVYNVATGRRPRKEGR